MTVPLESQERDLNPLRILRQLVQPTEDILSGSWTSLLFEVQVTSMALRNPILALLAKGSIDRRLFGLQLGFDIYQKFNCCFTVASIMFLSFLDMFIDLRGRVP